jgi:hypothetical protein
LSANTCKFVASIPQPLHRDAGSPDRAISIAENNLFRGLRRHLHRARASQNFRRTVAGILT